MKLNHIYCGDALKVLRTLPDNFADCGVTSTPYFNQRDYGMEGQIGLETTPEEFIAKLVEIFREFRRVLKPTGTLWVNIGDSYCSTAPGTMGDNIHIEGTKEATKRARKVMRPPTPNGCKPKDLIGIPWMLAFALRADGWYLRQDIIWSKKNCMPESVKDRCTKSHEYIFLLSRQAHYYFDSEAIKEPVADSTVIRLAEPNIESQQGSGRGHGGVKTMKAVRYGGNKYTRDTDTFYRTKSGNAYEFREMRNKRSVWEVSTRPFKEAHFATFPEELITPCILAGCPQGGVVLDMFMGSGTTGIVALKNFRNYIGIELNPKYIEIAERRLAPYKSQIDMFSLGVNRI